jgi:S-adenosylmethionine-dependent methyltransferase
VQDRNFDDIAEKFSRNIYGTTKGQLRQAILWQDLDTILATFGAKRCACWMPAAAKGRRP